MFLRSPLPATILICEDDDDILEVAKTVLEEKQYTVITCAHSEKVLEVLHAQKVDLVLVDLWMPKVGGAEITRSMKEDPQLKDIPVIILSANKDTALVAEEVGAQGFLAKPFDIEDLEKIVATHVSP
jgi:two-component system, OmpR family, alkaline phosphatase synthesis response regulator PhoP